MFQVKICGITNVADALAVAQAGADAVGLNFYRGSPRFVGPEEAKAIVAALPPEMVKVGVFVDTPAEEICRMFDELPLDLIQLHGDQPPEFLLDLGGRPAMPAFRIGRAGFAHVGRHLAACEWLKIGPQRILLDSYSESAYGGTGRVLDISALGDYCCKLDRARVVLSGGLTPYNVVGVIDTIRPAAVDVASGVESSPGKKDAAAVAAFVQAARDAFARSELPGWP